MATIAQNLEILSAHLEDAYTAGANKGATIPSDHRAANLSAMIDSIPTGGSSLPDDKLTADVNFLDWDGRVLYAMTSAEALALTAMPRLPTDAELLERSGRPLKCYGWNVNNFESFRTQVSGMTQADVGCLVSENCNDTEISIVLDDNTGRDCSMCWAVGSWGTNMGNRLSIDWGDGNITPDYVLTNSGSIIDHTYAANGSYLIKARAYNANSSPTTYGSVYIQSLGNTQPVSNSATTGRSWQAKYDMFRSLKAGQLTRLGQIDAYHACSFCHKLEYVDLGLQGYPLVDCTFYYCTNLKHVVGAAFYVSGSNVFGYTKSLHYVYEVTNAVNFCIIRSSTFSTGGLNRLSLRYNNLFGQATMSSGTFYQTGLERFVFPYPVGTGWSFGTTNTSFRYCTHLNGDFIMPPGITNIPTNMFASTNCDAFVFRNYTTIPTIGTATFDIAKAVIVVPDDMYDSWIAATNWTRLAQYNNIWKMSEYYGS